MRKLEIAGHVYTGNEVFICAELGCNHMGDPEICEKMIIEAAKCGANAVKMQKRDNAFMFTKSALAHPYDNETSYGKTYGEHRENLDWFGEKEFKIFKATAEKHGILFFATPFEAQSAQFLNKIGMPLWKIASCDTNNIPLIRMVASYGQPLLISTGGASWEEINRIVYEISPINSNFALLHCISTYPNTDENVNIGAILKMRKRYPDHLIGFSSHHAGLDPLKGAVWYGARILEAHFTLNRGWKGTDHGFSLEPQGLRKLCEDASRIITMMGSGEKIPLKEELAGFKRKMGKGLYLARSLPMGAIIEPSDIVVKSPAGGFSPSDTGRVIGRALLSDCSTGVALDEGMVK